MVLDGIDISWRESLKDALKSLDNDYLNFLMYEKGYIPKREVLFNVFKTLPKDRVKYILFGQDPYPREESATGYAFIDGRVKSIFSDRGLSKEVNRATSLRNFIKMLLVADNRLKCDDLSQKAVAKIDKVNFINGIDELRKNFERRGVLLLNNSLVFTDKKDTKKHIRAWRGFIQTFLDSFEDDKPILILFGNFSKEMKSRFNLEDFKIVEIEHPYNHSFICNRLAIDTFEKMKLLYSS